MNRWNNTDADRVVIADFAGGHDRRIVVCTSDRVEFAAVIERYVAGEVRSATYVHAAQLDALVDALTKARDLAIAKFGPPRTRPTSAIEHGEWMPKPGEPSRKGRR